LKLAEKLDGLPLNHLLEVQRNRNFAVHAGLQLRSKRQLSERDLECFDHVIRYFGI
jgi:hypothetical protein